MNGFGEAWLLAFLMAATLGAGGLAVHAVGILLREQWVEPLSRIFGPVGRGMPILILLAIPLVARATELYPWARTKRAVLVLAMTAATLLLWSVVGRLLARSRPSRVQAGLSLLLLILSAAVSFEDWALSRDTTWAGSLNGLAMMLGGAAGFLGLAVLLHGCPEEPEARTGLERALLTLGVFALWLLFVPFVTVWAADLPAEAAWYLRRQEGRWFWLQAGVILPALIGAVIFAAKPQWANWRMRMVCGLLLLQHLALVLWTVRPDAPLAPAAILDAPHPVTDVIVISLIALLVSLTAWLARRPRTESV